MTTDLRGVGVMDDDRCYIADLEKKVKGQKKRIKELKADLAGRDQVYQGLKSQYKNLQDLVASKDRELVEQAADWKKVVDRQESTLQLRQNLINQREGERNRYKDMCDEYQGEIDDLSDKIALLEADLLTMAEVKDEELRKVVDREHAIHNEAAAGMIARIKELEKQIFDWKGVADQDENRITKLQKALDLAANNEPVWMKQLAERYLVIQQKTERIEELQQANSKLILDLEYNEKLLAQYQEAFQSGDHVHHEDLEVDLAKVLNYWSQDAYLNIPDYLIAKHLIRHLDCIRKMQDETRVWNGGSPPGAESITNARLAHISIDDDGLGTIEVKE